MSQSAEMHDKAATRHSITCACTNWIRSYAITWHRVPRITYQGLNSRHDIDAELEDYSVVDQRAKNDIEFQFTSHLT